MPTLTLPTAAAPTVRPAPPEAATRNQRPRVDFTIDSSSTLSPLETAVKMIEGSTESLHDGIADLLLLKGKELITLRHRLASKESAINSLESHETRIPVSARVDFKLSCMKGVEETQDFNDLQARNTTLLDTFRKDLKAHVIECGRIEIVFLEKQLATIFAKTISQVTAMFHVAQGVDPAKNHPTALKMITENPLTLLKHLDEADALDFKNLYLQVNTVGTLTEAERTNTNPNADDIRRALVSIFVSPWDRYLEAQKAKEMAITLRKHMREHVLVDMTADAVNVVDQELPATREQLAELIQKEVARATKQRKDKENSKSAKNNSRGRKKTGASQTNQKNQPAPKNQTNQRPKQTQAKKQSGKAAESNKGGKKGKGKQPRGRSRSKSPMRSASTRNGPARRNRQS
jgi:hypothetical protein